MCCITVGLLWGSMNLHRSWWKRILRDLIVWPSWKVWTLEAVITEPHLHSVQLLVSCSSMPYLNVGKSQKGWWFVENMLSGVCLTFVRCWMVLRWVESVLGERSKQVWALNKIVVDFLTSKVNFNQVLIFQHLKCDLLPAWLFFKMWQFNSSQAEFLKKHRSCNVWYCVRKLDN